MFYGNAQSIVAEFIRNLDEILQNHFHLRSSFDKTKYIIDQNIWECYGHFDLGFKYEGYNYTVWHMEFLQGETLSFRFI